MAELDKEKLVAEIDILREQAETARFQRRLSNKLVGDIDQWPHERITRAFPKLTVFFPFGIAANFNNHKIGEQDHG